MRTMDKSIALLASIRAGLYAEQQLRELRGETQHKEPTPFVTISRQAGAGGRSLARLLVERLNTIDSGERPWALWDRELLERITEEHHIPAALVESLEHPRPWLEDLLAGISLSNDAANMDEFQVYRRVASTVRGLARAGRSVIVGRGGVYATSDLPGGVHVRLVAPLEYRVARMARLMKVSEAKAAAEIHRLDRHREAFHRRYWPGKALMAELFTITLNSAAITEDQMVASILPLVQLPGSIVVVA